MMNNGSLVFGLVFFSILLTSAFVGVTPTVERKEYKCFVDICNRKGNDWQFCDHAASEQRCRYCSEVQRDCWTAKMPRNCTTFCKEQFIQQEKVKGCGPINQTAHGHHNGSSNGHGYGDVIGLQCDSGYHCDGPCSISCIGFGYYTGTLKCAVKRCGPINQTDHGHHNGSNNGHVYGDVIGLQCDSGYHCDGPCSISCIDLGYYAGSLKCAENYCQAFLPSKTGKYSPEKENYVAGDTVYFTCTEGLTLEGKPTATCMENGSWNIIETPACIQSKKAFYIIISVEAILIGALTISLIAVKCYPCTRNTGTLKDSGRRQNKSDKERSNITYRSLSKDENLVIKLTDETDKTKSKRDTFNVKPNYERQVSRSETDPTLIENHDEHSLNSAGMQSRASESDVAFFTLSSINSTPAESSNSNDSGFGKGNKKEATQIDQKPKIEVNINVTNNCSNSNKQANNFKISDNDEGQNGKKNTSEHITKPKPHSPKIDKHPIEETGWKSDECHGELQVDNDSLSANNDNGRTLRKIINEQEDPDSKDRHFSATSEQHKKHYPQCHAQARDANDKIKFAIGEDDIPSGDVKKGRNESQVCTQTLDNYHSQAREDNEKPGQHAVNGTLINQKDISRADS